MIVVDTNVISYLLIPGPLTKMAQTAARQATWSAPLLWRSEFLNVLAIYMRQQGLPLSDAKGLMTIDGSPSHLFIAADLTIDASGTSFLNGPMNWTVYKVRFGESPLAWQRSD